MEYRIAKTENLYHCNVCGKKSIAVPGYKTYVSNNGAEIFGCICCSCAMHVTTWRVIKDSLTYDDYVAVGWAGFEPIWVTFKEVYKVSQVLERGCRVCGRRSKYVDHMVTLQFGPESEDIFSVHKTCIRDKTTHKIIDSILNANEKKLVRWELQKRVS